MPNDFYDLPDMRYDEAKPGSKDYQIKEWCDSRLEEGKRFVESAVGYDKIESAQNSIFAYERESSASYVPTPKPLSRTRANLCAKTAEDLTADLTDTRIFWNYQTRNQKYESQVRLCNKDAEDWYTSRNIDLRLGDMIRWYTIAGSGFGHLYYNRRLRDMMLEAVDPRSVFPIEPISYHTLQDALGVILRQPRTPHWVKAEYDKDVKPDIGASGISGWFTRTFGGMTKNKHSGPLSKSRGEDTPIPATPTVFVNTMYLNDTRVNKTKNPIKFGYVDGEKTPWSYEAKPGAPLYPFKRLVSWTTDTLLYDDTSPYWHAMYPILKLTLNPWPNAWLGKAPLWDVLPLNQSLDSLLRVIDDHAAKLAQPGVVADRNVSRAELNKFNSRTPGYQIRTNMAAGKGIQIQVEPPLQQSLWQHVTWIEGMIQKLSGTADMSSMSQLNQIPSEDTLDTIYKMMTSQNRIRSRILEGFMKEFAEMYLYCIAEFDTLSKRVAKFGPSAVTPEDFDYDPRTFIPDDVPDGTPGDIASTEDALASEGPRPQYERWRQVAQSIAVNYKPSSLLNSAAQQDRLEDLMLGKMGYLDFFSIMEAMGKENIAPPTLNIPGDVLSRLQLQQQLGIGMIANAQGRKATDQAPPTMGQNANGPTLQTS
jgi:hypothetical protein